MRRWYADTNPQHMLPGSAACIFGTSNEQVSKPAHPGRRV